MKPRLIVLHGALGSAHQFESLRTALPDVDVHVLEFHGHGHAADDAPWTIDAFANDVERFLKDGPKGVAVFGYSMGGYVALRVAHRSPDLISKILTLGTKLQWTPEGAAREIKMLEADVIEAKVPAFAADLQRRHGVDRWRIVLRKTAEMMLALGDNPVLREDAMATVTIPVRYGLGDRDEMVSLYETVRFYRATPGAELVVLPSTRHPIEKVHLPLLVDQIRQFLLV